MSDNKNIYWKGFHHPTIYDPIIGDAILILSRNPNALKFTSKEEFLQFAATQKYFSGSESYAYDSKEDFNKGIKNPESSIKFETIEDMKSLI